MWSFLAMAALRGDGLRPELKELFDRVRRDPHAETFVRADGMLQSGPDPKSEAVRVEALPPKQVA